MAADPAHRHFVAYRRAGNPTRMARVFDLTAPKLLLVARHLTRDPQQAEDLVQSAFLDAIRDAAGFDERQPLLPWLVAILTHRARDLHRRAIARQDAELADHDTVADHREVEPLRALADRDAAARVATALDALPEPYRQVLVLRLIHGLTPSQIAHALGRSAGTVRVQLRRGLAHLRRALPKGLALPAVLVLGNARGLVSVRADLLGSLPPAAATAGWIAGGLLMKKAVLLTMLAAGVLLALSLPSRVDPAPARAQPLLGAVAIAAGKTARTEASRDLARVPLAAPALTAPPAHAATRSDGDGAVLRIRVLDAAARPVPGMPVIAGVRGDHRGPMPQRMGITGDDGVLVCERLQSQCATWGVLLGDVPRSVRLSTLADAVDTGVEIALDALPADCVTLHAPDTGSISVHVRAADHHALCTRTFVELFVAPIGSREWPEYAAQRDLCHASDGSCSFDHIAVGSAVRIAASADGVDIGSVVALGPSAAGERVDVVVTVASDVPTLRGRVLRDDGAAVRCEPVTLWLERPGQHRRYQVSTDGEGTFACPIQDEWTGGAATVVIVGLGASCDGAELAARLPARPLHGGVNELGDVSMARPPLLLAGRLVDETGAPVAASDVQLVVERRADVGVAPQTSWRALPVHVAGGEDGAFSVRGFSNEAALAVDVIPEGRHASIVPVPFTAGQTGLELIVPTARFVHLRARIGSVERRWLWAELSRQGAPALRFSSTGDVSVATDRVDFTWRSLPPGDYDLRLWLRGDPQPLLARDHVESHASQDDADAQLVDVDLASSLRLLHVAVADPDGKRFDATAGELIVDDDHTGPITVAPRDGVFSLPCAATPRQGVLDVPGFHRQTVEALATDTVVRLGPAVAVEVDVVLPRDVPLPPGVRVRAFLRAETAPPRSPLLRPAPTDGIEGARDGDTYRFELPAGGAYRVTVGLEDDATHRRVVVDGIDPDRVTVAETSSEPRLDIHLSADALLHAIDALSR